jgi:hypothetical protein
MGSRQYYCELLLHVFQKRYLQEISPRDGGTRELPVSLSIKKINLERCEVSTAVTVNNTVFWDVTPCGSCKIRRFGGT